VKLKTSWYSERLGQEVGVVRYGHFGQPVLLFPTAGGDCEEAERMHLIGALSPLIEGGRIKVYTCDSVAGRAWIDSRRSGAHKAWVQNRFDAFVTEELVPAIRMDCRSADIEIVTAGASIGAYNALASLCRHPDLFKAAIGMSGTYNLEGWMGGDHTLDFHFSSPMHFLPRLGDGEQLGALRSRFALLVCGQGRWESPSHSWNLAHALGSRGIPNRVDLWGHEWDHDWPSWRVMLPLYLSHWF
jgi:esterase/lipase superfamily enzyme